MGDAGCGEKLMTNADESFRIFSRHVAQQGS